MHLWCVMREVFSEVILVSKITGRWAEPEGTTSSWSFVSTLIFQFHESKSIDLVPFGCLDACSEGLIYSAATNLCKLSIETDGKQASPIRSVTLMRLFMLGKNLRQTATPKNTHQSTLFELGCAAHHHRHWVRTQPPQPPVLFVSRRSGARQGRSSFPKWSPVVYSVLSPRSWLKLDLCSWPLWSGDLRAMTGPCTTASVLATFCKAGSLLGNRRWY